MNKEKKKELIKEAIYDVIYEQVKGLIDIEIDNNYLFKKYDGKYLLYYEKGSGLDVYICKKSYLFNEDVNMVLHLHKEDFLYFIMNFKEKKQEMIDFINEYISKEEK